MLGTEILLVFCLIFLICFSKANLNIPGVFSFFMLFPVSNPMGYDVELLVKFVCFCRLGGGRWGLVAFP